MIFKHIFGINLSFYYPRQAFFFFYFSSIILTSLRSYQFSTPRNIKNTQTILWLYRVFDFCHPSRFGDNTASDYMMFAYRNFLQCLIFLKNCKWNILALIKAFNGGKGAEVSYRSSAGSYWCDYVVRTVWIIPFWRRKKKKKKENIQ